MAGYEHRRIRASVRKPSRVVAQGENAGYRRGQLPAAPPKKKLILACRKLFFQKYKI